MGTDTPGLFITATDTEVGKTAATCAIAVALRRLGIRVGVCKPMSAGCRREREQLINADAEALAHFADCRMPLDVINPVRYRQPVAPAAAADATGIAPDYQAIAQAIAKLSQAHDLLLIEGIGGWMVPLDEQHTVEDLALALGYPVVVVTRHNLGTLNHTALTCRAIRDSGLSLAGLIINRYQTDTTDLSIADNPRLLARQNRTEILATLPNDPSIDPEAGRLSEDLIEAAATCYWPNICRPARPVNDHSRRAT